MDNKEIARRFSILAIRDIREYAEGRKSDIARGAETPALAALLVEKYGYGLAKSCSLLIDASDGYIKPVNVIAEVDKLIEEIDPDFKENRHNRWAARPADLLVTA